MNLVALSGGIGGARLVEGLHACIQARGEPDRLTVICNTGDDLRRFGLLVCPDVDTVLYTLADAADRSRGWGRADERFLAMEQVLRLAPDDDLGWFSLGDRDLGLHLVRSEWLARGQRLTEVTARLGRGLGLGDEVCVLPMADAPKPTVIDTVEEGTLDFQRWLVARGGEPTVRAVRWTAAPPATQEVLDALDAADLVVIPPSNPYVSIEPILTLPGVRERVRSRRVVGVSPIVDGRAVKGPLAEMIPALEGRPASAAAVRDLYGDLVDGFVVERGDAAGVRGPVLEAPTVMGEGRAERARLAAAVLEFAETLV